MGHLIELVHHVRREHIRIQGLYHVRLVPQVLILTCLVQRHARRVHLGCTHKRSVRRVTCVYHVPWVIILTYQVRRRVDNVPQVLILTHLDPRHARRVHLGLTLP